MCLLTEHQILDDISQEVDRCLQDSFELRGDMESDNKLLADDMAWARQHNIDYHPTITINNFTYRGDIDFVDVREAICAAYQERPGGCTLDEIWNAEPSQNPNHNRQYLN